MTLIVDYSWARPDPAAIRDAGYQGVMRYLSPDPSKNLTPGERDRLFAAGLSIGLVWESTANRAAQGVGAGITDAGAADAQADALGYPAGCPIFYAVDFAATPAAVRGYFTGVSSASRRPVGVYGSATVVEGVSAPYRWQTSAWSAGVVSPRAHLYQRQAPTVPHPIASAGEDVVLAAFPMWDGSLRAGFGAGVPTSTPTTTTITPGGPFMALTDQQQAEMYRWLQGLSETGQLYTWLKNITGTIGYVEEMYVSRENPQSRVGNRDLEWETVKQMSDQLTAALAAAPAPPVTADPAAIAAEILKLGPQLAAEIAAHLTVTVTPTP